MLLPHHKINNKQGFTLLEVMLTILLIGITATVVVMTLPTHTNKANDPKWQAESFVVLLQLAEDEALTSGNEYGIVLKESSYQFAQYNYTKKQWLPIFKGGLSKRRNLSEDIRLTMTLKGSIWDKDQPTDEQFIKDDEPDKIKSDDKIQPLKPQVFVMSSGELTPFTVEFSNHNTQKSSFISVGMNGDIKRKKDQ